MVHIDLGHSYKNRRNDVVFITKRVESTHPDYQIGYRFIDDRGRKYKANGNFNAANHRVSLDLIRCVEEPMPVRTLL